jgi:hypothetical protein
MTAARVTMKALEVLIDGISIGVFVPPLGAGFVAGLTNGAEETIEAEVSCTGSKRSLSWHLPAIRNGQRISFKMVESPVSGGTEPQIIRSKQD